MHTIRVETPSARYDVVVGSGLVNTLAPRIERVAGRLPRRIFVLTSPEIWALWGEALTASFAESPIALFLPPGEKHKTLANVEKMARQMIEAGADRGSLLIAFGGGIVGDVGGFLAAIFMRGIPYVQVPTTFLSQVDSSVGGKTGVNLREGKNLIGSFHHPLAVFADIGVLGTLPDRELRSGLMESVKAGIIRDRTLVRFLEEHVDQVLGRDPKTLEKVIAASVRMKADVVNRDERESGLRMILNFGHTLGHAIEQVTRYKVLLHGEAVGWGMIAALQLARRRGTITGTQAQRMESLIHLYGPLPPLKVRAARLVAASGADKKNIGGVRRFVLPIGLGDAGVVDDVTAAELQSAAEYMLSPRCGKARLMPVSGAKPAGAQDESSAAQAVRQMFNSIAPRYDLLNHVLSANVDRLWWRRTARRFRDVLAQPDAAILDICCGTGDMTMALLKHRPANARPILAGDFARAMLSRGAHKFGGRGAVAIEADAMHLPLRAASLDLIVTAFGFRNLSNYEDGLREFHRVLKPGGQLGILDFSEPGGLLGKLYALYFRRVLPAIGRILCGKDGPYNYLPASVGNFPPPPQILEMMRAAGYSQCAWQPYTFGIAGLYTARREG